MVPGIPTILPSSHHLEDSEDLASAESQSMHDTDEFRTPDSEDVGSTDVSKPYRKVSCTYITPQPTEPEVDQEAEPEEEGPTSAFHDSPSQHQEVPRPMRTPELEKATSHAATPHSPSQSPVRNTTPHPSQTPDHVTVIGSRGEAAIYPEVDETKHPAAGTHRITLPPYDSLSEFDAL